MNQISSKVLTIGMAFGALAFGVTLPAPTNSVPLLIVEAQAQEQEPQAADVTGKDSCSATGKKGNVVCTITCDKGKAATCEDGDVETKPTCKCV